VSLLRVADALLARAIRGGVIGGLVLIQALLTFNVVARFVPSVTTVWTEEIIELLFAWVVFVGGALLYRQGVLFRVELVEEALPRSWRRPLNLVIQACMLAFAVLLMTQGWLFTRETFVDSPFLHIRKVPWHAALPAGGLLFTVYAVAGLWNAFRGGQVERRTGDHVI